MKSVPGLQIKKRFTVDIYNWLSLNLLHHVHCKFSLILLLFAVPSLHLQSVDRWLWKGILQGGGTKFLEMDNVSGRSNYCQYRTRRTSLWVGWVSGSDESLGRMSLYIAIAKSELSSRKAYKVMRWSYVSLLENNISVHRLVSLNSCSAFSLRYFVPSSGFYLSSSPTEEEKGSTVLQHKSERPVNKTNARGGKENRIKSTKTEWTENLTNLTFVANPQMPLWRLPWRWLNLSVSWQLISKSRQVRQVWHTYSIIREGKIKRWFYLMVKAVMVLWKFSGTALHWVKYHIRYICSIMWCISVADVSRFFICTFPITPWPS